VIRENRGLSEEDAWFIAALSRGSFGRALVMDAQKEKGDREQFLALSEGLAGMRDDEILTLAAGIARDREGFDRLLDIGIERLRDLLVFHETRDERLLVFAGAAERRAGLPVPFILEKVLQDIELFNRCRDLLERRVSPQLVAENLLLKLARP
jgi:DNA polymerase III gamma/tau subunit